MSVFIYQTSLLICSSTGRRMLPSNDSLQVDTVSCRGAWWLKKRILNLNRNQFSGRFLSQWKTTSLKTYIFLNLLIPMINVWHKWKRKLTATSIKSLKLIQKHVIADLCYWSSLTITKKSNRYHVTTLYISAKDWIIIIEHLTEKYTVKI